MNALETVFWLCILALLYNYAGYPILLFGLCGMAQAKRDIHYLIRRIDRRGSAAFDRIPHVAILIAVHNEEVVIGDKIENTLQLDYPSDRLDAWFGLDAPTDSTAEVLKRVSNSRLHITEFAVRRGKLAVLKDLAQRTQAEILVLTDANTMLDSVCVRKLVRHFADPKVAAVSGEEIRTASREIDPGGESIYWRYESAIKILESRINCSQGGNGAVLAIRRSLFDPNPGLIVEDFQIPLELRFKGYRVIYDPEAVAMEEIPPTAQAQFARRVRIGAGNYQTLLMNPGYLNPVKGLLSFTFISHRVLRWLAPFLLILAFASNLFMAAYQTFAAMFIAQILFYSAAFAGYVLKKRGHRSSLFSIPVNFCSMNVALLLGFFAYVSGRQGATWNASPRRKTMNRNLVTAEVHSEIRPAA